MNENKMAIELIDKINETQINIIEMLNNTNADAKEEFLKNSELAMPVCIYDNLDVEKVRKNLEILDSVSLDDIALSLKSKELLGIVFNNSVYSNSFVLANFEFNNFVGDRSNTESITSCFLGNQKRARI